MFKKSNIAVLFSLIILMTFVAIAFGGKANNLTLTGFSFNTPYKATWTGTGNVDGLFDGVATLEEAAIEWVNPTDKSVNVGLGGENPVTATSPASVYVDENGQIIIDAKFPYLAENCSGEFSPEDEQVEACVELVNTKPDPLMPPLDYLGAFLSFYGQDPYDYYKDNWEPLRMIMLQLTLKTRYEYILPNGKPQVSESPVARCRTDSTYRDFGPDVTEYVCNDIGDPFAFDDNYIIKKDVYTDNVLENDYDFEQNYPMTAQLVADPDTGSVFLNSDGSFTYEKAGDFDKSDCFTYKAVDSLGNEGNVAEVCLESFK